MIDPPKDMASERGNTCSWGDVSLMNDDDEKRGNESFDMLFYDEDVHDFLEEVLGAL